MDPDKRIVPEKHISYLLEENTLSERTIEVKKLLQDSPDKIHHVAHTWMGHSGLNPLARIIIHHIPEVPKKIHTRHHTENSPAHHESIHHGESDEHGHTDLHTAQRTHASHHTEHGHGDHHDTHGHSHHDDHGHGGHGHASHGGGHGHEHQGGHFSSFISTGHWFGDQGAYIFGMLGRIIGEIIGYLFKTLAVAIIFGPTRTAILVALSGTLLNSTMDTSLPIGIAASIAGIIHLVFTGVNKISGGHGKSSHGGGGHGHSEAHGGGHGHH